MANLENLKQSPLKKIPIKFQSTNEQYSNSNLSQSDIVNNEETIFQVHHQQQHWQPFPRQISIEKRRNSSLLANPRKSLAMIFSQISNNLGFTQETSTEYLDEGIRSSVSSQRLMDRGIFNTIIGGNQNQHRTSGSIGTLSNVHYNKSNNPNTILTSNNNNTMSPTTTTVDRSILVDLLCCTCCTNSDDEDEAYSNLIENHRLARIVTMGAILTILGLIFAYIIRSATETQTAPNASGTTGSPPSSPTTTTTLTVAMTITNVYHANKLS
ncbi:hypothetical protein Smp_033200 [Schistosoma mansoni]|uniref:hypothetical protein n=1 Tax=Schistosoma mansoni TaxID=6183 RepID=UPI0001A6374A|nr:hypothetical protein Smp_033200 [Schistosoma mansoni]|eukprot:XP_018653624.1 hypothetical protein Smp_033200 [Schistosoma mansoni]